MGQPPLRVLLVEDEENDYWMTRRLLAESDKRPFLLDWVPSVQAGLDAISRSPYDVCLLDLRLPDGDGIQFLNETNRRGIRCPIILLTGQGEYPDDVEAMHAGAVDFLVKAELTPALLERSIRYAVERFAAMESVRKAHEDLQLSELRFRSVVQSANEAIIIADSDSRILSWNRAAERIFGYSDGEVTGFPMELLFTERYRDRFKVKGTASLIGKAVELDALHKDGSDFPVELSLASWSTHEGTFLTAIIRDISERRRLEEMRLSKEDAEEASRSKNTFIARMSHELRTPLSSILGFAQILQKNKKGNLQPDDIDFLQRILLNATDQLNLINTLLDLSRIEAGHMETTTAVVPLDALIRDTIRQIEHRTRGTAITLTAEIPETLIPVSTDGAKLKQIVINLIDNALKFTEKGSVVVRVHASSDGKPVRIDVTDTGRGIEPEHLRRIFEPFERVLSPDISAPAGTGLGLAISRSLCELLGCRLEVRSQSGAGSTFSVVFGAEAYRFPLSA